MTTGTYTATRSALLRDCVLGAAHEVEEGPPVQQAHLAPGDVPLPEGLVAVNLQARGTKDTIYVHVLRVKMHGELP